jgi:hypothetical protein
LHLPGEGSCRSFGRDRELNVEVPESETQLPGKPNLPGAGIACQRGVDLAELTGRDSGVRTVEIAESEVRSVGCAEPFSSQLEVQALSDLEVAEKAGIQVEQAWSAKIGDVPPGVAETRLACRNGGERRNIEIVAGRVGVRAGLPGPWSNAPGDMDGADQVGGLGISGCIERRASTHYGERRSAQSGEQPVELPAAR